MRKIIATVTLSLFSSQALSQDFARADADLKTFDETVASKNADFAKTPPDPHDKSWVKSKIAHMVEVDQYMRNFSDTPFKRKYSDEESKYFQQKFGKRWREIDTQDTSDLKALLKIYDWFGIKTFGKKADQDAWLLVQHADLDHPFQEHVLKILEKLYPIGETEPKNYAYLYDRVASSFNDQSKRKLQRYGTQGSCTGPGAWIPLPVEDPPNLDQRRKKVGLGSEADYIKGFKDICH